MFLSNSARDDQPSRRQLTNFALKLAVVGTGMALILEICYFVLTLSGRQSVVLVLATAAALAYLAILLRLNQAVVVPHWFASTLFLLALTLFALICDTPEHIMNGRSTMFLLVPILLSGVLIHPYAPFVFATWIVVLFGGLAYVTTAGQVEPLTVVFFYVFSGLVCAVFRNLAKSTSLLRREAAQSETILSALRGGYILTDRSLTILRMNERARDILPLARVDTHLLDVIRDPNLEISGSDWSQLTGVISGVDAGDARIQIAGKHFYVANKYIEATREHLIFLRDISAEVEIERLKDTALAMVSHELRTPLTAIRGQAELAVREPDTAVSNASRILVNVQRLLIMVENLLSQSRLRTGKIRNVPSPTSVETVFRVVYSLVATEARDKGLELEMKIDRDLPVVMVDAVLLQQVLTNLVSNAIKFTRQGRVRMEAGMAGENRWQISVTDMGPGIPICKRTEIFKEFFQGTGGTVYDRPHQGNGLGLSIVKGLTEQMGGRLSLQSEEGVGSVFKVVFPLVLPQEITRKRKSNG